MFKYFYIFLLLALSGHCYAFQISPLTTDIDAFGRSAQQKYELANNFDYPIKIEITASFLKSNLSVMSESSAEEDFIIIPDVVSIEPGQKQAVMVRYLGEPDISSSKTYLLNFNQVDTVNANKNDESSVIQYVVNYEAVLNVLPRNAKSQLLVTSIKPLGEKKWELTIDNVGNKYEWISDTKWQVSSKGKKETLLGEDVVENINQNFFLPFSTTKAIFTDITSLGLNEKIEIEINGNN
ncbi:fimbria/pilus periplasmic chaperone [Photobacterium sp. SDRW27]|uniref:fimbria/pilus periplasmic chaperone n=1 Tax=Photobacterium obscurum TaxID=2829490 RepID=UPI0022441C0C|nr:fimbria/pilus periplasmic chaperone [Photobacterium obscurum]MCW8327210.1 fimbria/pilus periplasmic chaperone [Photobacterium obscurum]